ncbi:unnamed protein product [Closterium sp. Yama58-4]|nr:unnamed protein product [Closterium sp. Yama58-4]
MAKGSFHLLLWAVPLLLLASIPAARLEDTAIQPFSSDEGTLWQLHGREFALLRRRLTKKTTAQASPSPSPVSPKKKKKATPSPPKDSSGNSKNSGGSGGSTGTSQPKSQPKAKSPPTVQGGSTQKSPKKSPNKSPNASPTKSPGKSPDKSPAKSPNKSPNTNPDKSPNKSPANKSPDKSPSKSPSKPKSPPKPAETNVTKSPKSPKKPKSPKSPKQPKPPTPPPAPPKIECEVHKNEQLVIMDGNLFFTNKLDQCEGSSSRFGTVFHRNISRYPLVWDDSAHSRKPEWAGGRKRAPAPTLEPAWERFGVCSSRKGPVYVTITPRQIGTRWKGWGTSLAWLGNYISGFPQAAMDPLLDLMFLPPGLNINIVRFNIGGGSLPQYSPQLYTDSPLRWRAMPGYWPAQAAGFNWTADSRQQAVLLGAKARGVNVFEAFSNSPPWWMTESKDVSGAKKPWRTNLLRRYEGKFAKYLVKVVEGLAKSPTLGNIEFDTLEPFNEGLEGQWVSGMEQEGCNFNPPEMSRVLLKTWLALRKRRLKTKLVGVDSNAVLTSIGLPLVLGNTLLHRINVHGYPLPLHMYLNVTTAQAKLLTTARYTHMKRLARSLQKEVWVSESGPLLRDGSAYDLSLYMMRNIIESVNILEASAYSYWQIYDGSDKWSLIRIDWDHPPGYTGPFDAPVLLKRFWMLKQFTDLVRPGSLPLVVPSKCQHTVAAFYSTEKRTVSLFIVIQRAEDATLDVRLTGFKLHVEGRSEAVSLSYL